MLTSSSRRTKMWHRSLERMLLVALGSVLGDRVRTTRRQIWRMTQKRQDQRQLIDAEARGLLPTE
jgi:hypothetical protein